MIRDEIPLIKKTFAIIRSSLVLGLIYIVFYGLLINFARIAWFRAFGSQAPAFGPHFIVFQFLPIILSQILVAPLLDAGLFGLIFLMVTTGKWRSRDFLTWARAGYTAFVKITLILVLIHSIRGGISTLLWNPVLKSPGQIPWAVDLYNDATPFLVQWLFLFAFPIATLGTHFKEKLKPIRRSLALTTLRFREILFVAFLMVADMCIGKALSWTLMHLPIHICEGKLIASWTKLTLTGVIGYAIEYIILIYSFVFLVEKVFKERLPQVTGDNHI